MNRTAKILFLFFGLVSYFSYDVNAQIKAITFNIRYDNPGDSLNNWKNRKLPLSDFLNKEAADFLGLQEVLHHQLMDLDSLLNTKQKTYSWVGVGRDDGNERGEYSPIFYNVTKYQLIGWETRWLSETPFNPSKSWDAALPRIATIAKFQDIQSKKQYVVINTHFDHMGTVARLNSAKLIASWVDTLMQNDEKILLLGDFNANLKSDPIQQILKTTKLKVVNTRFQPNTNGTFNGFSDKPGPEIDFIFYSDNFTITSTYVDRTKRENGLYLSDHFPVIANFQEQTRQKINVSLCTPASFLVQKFRSQVEFNVSKRQSIGINYTHLNALWITNTVGLEYRIYSSIRTKSKFGFYGNLSAGGGTTISNNRGSFNAISAGIVNQFYFGQKQSVFIDLQLGGRAAKMFSGDLEANGGFGGLLYVAGPLSVLDFRVNLGIRF